MKRSREEWLAERERTVEVGGFEFRIRRLSRLEFLELSGRLPVLLDDEDPAPNGKGVTPQRVVAELRSRVEIVSACLVDPTLSADEVDGALPVEIVDGLSERILEFSGLTRTFGGAGSPSDSSTSIESASDTGSSRPSCLE